MGSAGASGRPDPSQAAIECEPGQPEENECADEVDADPGGARILEVTAEDEHGERDREDHFDDADHGARRHGHQHPLAQSLGHLSPSATTCAGLRTVTLCADALVR